MLFSQIPFAESVKELFINSARKGTVAHAQLLYSGEGTASLALAVAYFGFLNCENPNPQDACGVCGSCYKLSKLVHPDLHFVFPVTTTAKFSKSTDAVSQNFLPEFRKLFLSNPYFGLNDWAAAYGAENKQPSISREDARNITKALSMKAFEAKYKTVIVFLPELMHPGAANAILKILEEPPKNTLFLLVSHAIDQIMTTILSRTQKIQVPAYTHSQIEQILAQKYQVPEQTAHQTAMLAQRNMAQALRMLEETDQDSMMPFFQSWMRTAYKRDFGVIVETAEEFGALPKPNQIALIDYSIHILREVLLSKYANVLTHLRQQELEFVEKFGSVLTVPKIEQIVSLLNASRYHLLRNANAKIEFSYLSIEIAKIFADR